jgi:microcystin synthetase protein McyJ
MTTNYSPAEINEHYATRHQLRGGIYGEKPYANYGLWDRPDMTIDEACDNMSELMARELGLNANDDVLECGSGYGATCVYLCTHHKPKSYIGLDVTEIRVQTAQELLAKYGVGNTAGIRLGNATALDFPDATFTKIIAIECAFHFDTREKFLQEAFRVLKPGGILAMTDILPAKTLDLTKLTNEEIRDYLGADLKRINDNNVYNETTYLDILKRIGYNPARLYSIKDRCATQFAEHLEKVAMQSPPDAKARRLDVANHFRTKFMAGADYVVVHAEKPAATGG